MAFCHLDDNHGKSWVIIMVKTASKRVRRKIAEATSDLIGKTIVDQITSAGKSKSKKTKQNSEKSKTLEIYIPPEKLQQIIDGLRLL